MSYCEWNKACRIDEHVDVKNCFCKKFSVGKLVLECGDKILNTTEILINDRKVAFAKSILLIHIISLKNTCLLLLVVICVSCLFHYAIY